MNEADTNGADRPLNERWQRLKDVVADAMELPYEDREAFVERACCDDEELCEEAKKLLSHPTGIPSPSPSTEPRRLGVGTMLGEFRVVSFHQEGGMGEVYLGERIDGGYDQKVAIKVVGGRGLLSRELLRRFLAERQLLADFGHPGIAHLYGGGTTDDGRPYLVMEWVEGEPIDEYCDRRHLSVAERLDVFRQVCSAVQYAHRHLVLHRDLKPSNILVTSGGTVKLIDFGIAKDLGESAKTPTTRLGAHGTPRYAGPEQLAGGAVTTATDVYALGVVLYELLTGQSPFDLDGDPLAGRTRTSPPVPPSTRLAGSARRRLEGDLDHVVLKAVEPNPSLRFQSVGELDREIDRYRRGLPLESRPGAFYRLGKALRRRWKGLAAAVVLLGLGTGLAWEALERRQLKREHDRIQSLSNRLGNYLVQILLSARGGGEVLDKMLTTGKGLLKVEEEFRDEPELRAVLLGAIGQVYRQQGRFAEAEPLLRECLELRRLHLPPDHELTGRAANNLALPLRGLGRYTEAKELLLEAIRIRRLHFPGDDGEVAVMINNLAGVLKELGENEEAVSRYREALDMKRRLPEKFDARSLALALKNYGTGLRAAGRLEEAVTAFLEALDGLEKEKDRAGVELHLGGVLRELGQFAESRECLEHALAVYGAESPKSDDVLLELALLDQAEGHLDVAEKRLRRVLKIRRQDVGNEHPKVGEVLVALARVLTEGGDVEGAKAAAEEALQIFRRCLPVGHWRIVEAERFSGH